MTINRFIILCIEFVKNLIATFATLYALMEVFTFLHGDGLKQIVLSYGLPLIYGVHIVIALWITFLKARNTQPKWRPRTSSKIGSLGVNPDPLSMCKYLQSLVIENMSIIQQASLKESYINELVQDLADGILRIYFFGHQNAGKSSLINALLNASDISPTFPGKMTTCLVRIRWGAKDRVIERYESGEEKIIRNSKLKKRMEDWALLAIESRPREVIIETSHDFLKKYKVEVVDSPGTGSSWTANYGISLEDEIVKSAISSAAVVVIVYRYIGAEFEAHESLIRDFGNNNIPTIAVCNLDPNWADELKRNKRNIQTTIASAEKRLRDTAKAKCYRIAIKGDEAFTELVRKEDGATIEDLRTYLIQLLSDRKIHVFRQAIRNGLILIDELIQDVSQHILQHQPYFNQIEIERNKISEAIADVREVLNNAYVPSNATVLSSALGSATALIAGTAASLLTAGTFIIWAATGAAVGAATNIVQDALGQRDFKKRLADKWTSLRKTLDNSEKINKTKVIRQEVIKKIRLSSLSESEHRSVLKELEKEINDNFHKIEGYDTYYKNQDLDGKLRELKEIFLKEQL